jgi:hypothetical protein
MFRTGIKKAIQASYKNVKKGDTIGYPIIDELPFDGVYLMGDTDNNQLLRDTVKLCVNRLHKIGMTNVINAKESKNIKLNTDEFVYKVLDMFQNCGMNSLAEEVVEYVGNTSKFTFELVYKDNYHQVDNNYNPNYIYIKLRTYYWIQVDNTLIMGSDFKFSYSELSLGERLLKTLNNGLPNSRRARTIHNYLDESIYMDPPRLRRINRYTGPPDYGVPVGLDGQELDIYSIELMDHYYDVCDKIIVENEDDHPVSKQIKELRQQYAIEWAERCKSNFRNSTF